MIRVSIYVDPSFSNEMSCHEIRTHAGTVDVDLLGSGGSVVEVESAVLDVEGGGLLLGAGTAGTLVGETGEQAALGRIEAGVLDTAAGVYGDDTEGVRLGGLGGGHGGGGGSSRGSNEEAREVHGG